MEAIKTVPSALQHAETLKERGCVCSLTSSACIILAEEVERLGNLVKMCEADLMYYRELATGVVR